MVRICTFKCKDTNKKSKKTFFSRRFTAKKQTPSQKNTFFNTLLKSHKKLKTPPLRRKPPLFPAPKTGKTGKKILPLRKGPKC